MAKKRAEIMAKVAAMGLAKPATTSEKPGPTNLPAKPTTSSSSTPLLPDPSELARRVAEARRRVAEATAKAEISSNPYIVRTTRTNPICFRFHFYLVAALFDIFFI